MLRLVASADRSSAKNLKSSHQAGIALIQVLMISAIISVLAIRFTVTAQDQTKIAGQLEDRTKAQFLAYSVLNEVIFSQLVDVIEPITTGQASSSVFENRSREITRWGTELLWQEGVVVSVQDLNGLLPQKYPANVVWEQLLLRHGLSREDVERYLGEWNDIQDPDLSSWVRGDFEPVKIRGGGYYLNGYAQNDSVVRWLFSERPILLNMVLEFSSVKAPFSTNIFHAPNDLLTKLFSQNVAETIIDARKQGVEGRVMLDGLLPRLLAEKDYLVRYESSNIRIKISSQVGTTRWTQSNIVNLAPSEGAAFAIGPDL